MIITGGDNELEIFIQERTPYFVKCFGCGVECSDWSKSSVLIKCLDWVIINGKLMCRDCALKKYYELKQEFENGIFAKAIVLTSESNIFCYKFKANLKAGICNSRVVKAREKKCLESYYTECLSCVQGMFVELFLGVGNVLRKAKVGKKSSIIF